MHQSLMAKLGGIEDRMSDTDKYKHITPETVVMTPSPDNLIILSEEDYDKFVEILGEE